eukprot:Gb_31711 [translate_table: standard]
MAMVLFLGTRGLSNNTQRTPPLSNYQCMMVEEQSHHRQPACRSRKGKNGEKKIPQRGLGVAQLEKLRLEEQQKQQAECLAATSVQRFKNNLSVMETHQSLVFVGNQNYNLQRQMKAFTPPTSNLINKTPPFPLDLIANHRDSIISLAGPNPINPKPTTQFLTGLLNAHHSSEENVPPIPPSDHNPSRNSASVDSSCITNVCMAPESIAGTGFLSGLWAGQNPNSTEMEDTKRKESFQLGLPSELQGCAVNPKEMRLFEPSLWPPGPPREPAELPVMGISSSGAMQTEPPSNQSSSANAAWPEEDMMPTRKRLWPFSPENLSSSIQSKATRLELANMDAADIFRNSFASSLEPVRMKLPWQATTETVSPRSKYLTDLRFSCDSGHRHTPKKSFVAQTTVKDSCSSTSSLLPGFRLNWKGFYENDISSSQENETPSDFLTLGLSSSGNHHFHGKPKEHSATSDGTDECGLSTHVQQETNADLSSPFAYPSDDGVLKHGPISTSDDGCSRPFYKFLGHESKTEGIADCLYEDNKKKLIDLDLRLTL